MKAAIRLAAVLTGLLFLVAPSALGASNRLSKSDARLEADLGASRFTVQRSDIDITYVDSCSRQGRRSFGCDATGYGEKFDCTASFAICWTDYTTCSVRITVKGVPKKSFGKVIYWQTWFLLGSASCSQRRVYT